MNDLNEFETVANFFLHFSLNLVMDRYRCWRKDFFGNFFSRRQVICIYRINVNYASNRNGTSRVYYSLSFLFYLMKKLYYSQRKYFRIKNNFFVINFLSETERVSKFCFSYLDTISFVWNFTRLLLKSVPFTKSF